MDHAVRKAITVPTIAQWIPVEERLPEDNPDSIMPYRSDDVLTRRAGKDGEDEIDICYFETCDPEAWPREWWIKGPNSYQAEGVTHWAPMPDFWEPDPVNPKAPSDEELRREAEHSSDFFNVDMGAMVSHGRDGYNGASVQGWYWIYYDEVPGYEDYDEEEA